MDKPVRGRRRELNLAEPRPVLRGLRLDESALEGHRGDDLQSRDPFSGDCDTAGSLRVPSTRRAYLQSRDPFSGDCDASMEALAWRFAWRWLAEPRPVLRGLRHPFLHLRVQDPADLIDLQSRDPFSGDCDVGATRRVAPTFLALRRLRE